VENRVIVDTKVVEGFIDSPIAQVLGYLAITQLEVGILLNFKYSELQWKRVARGN
jgi:GxxExxY protein